MQVLAVLCLVVGLLVGLLYAAVLIFRVSCRACGLESPGLMKSAGVVFVSWLVWTLCEAILLAVTQGAYDAAGGPGWEAPVACFFVALPLNLYVSSVLHVGLMRVPLGKAIEVWFVQYLILLSVVLLAAGVTAVAVLASR